MDCIGIRDLSGADYAWDVQIAGGAFGRADTDGFVGKSDVQGVSVRLGEHRDCCYP